MNVEEAVAVAKSWIATVYKDEGITNVGLEEVLKDEARGIWRVTIGFSRPWNATRTAITIIGGEPTVTRTSKVVTINDENKEILSLTNRND